MNKAYVLNDHTLCYSHRGFSFYGVLACKPSLGGLSHGPVTPRTGDQMRLATKADFDSFNVNGNCFSEQFKRN